MAENIIKTENLSYIYSEGTPYEHRAIDNVNIEQININTSQKKNKKASRVSFSDLVMIEVERSKSLK